MVPILKQDTRYQPVGTHILTKPSCARCDAPSGPLAIVTGSIRHANRACPDPSLCVSLDLNVCESHAPLQDLGVEFRGQRLLMDKD